MIKWIKVLIAGIFVSFYFFPFEFSFLPGVNTKMAMAGIGLVLYVIDLFKDRTPQINKDALYIVALGVMVSLCGYVSIVLNNTRDFTYATYFVSMFVWLGGAYTAVKIVKWLHGYVSVELICNYLIGVCAGQCILALLIDSVPAFKAIVDRLVIGFDFVDTKALTKAHRIYGIGAGLDVAGTRFAAVLVIMSALLQRLSISRYKNLIWLYLMAFILISVVGNMMARTTTVGVLVALLYWVMSSGILRNSLKKGNLRVWKYLLGSLCVVVPVIVYLYSNNLQFYENIRFAFEGFFSLAEQGQWETNSNNILKDMVVFPDNIKTWLIGDGYINNPRWSDPYYVGPIYGGYYKGTDIGYLRFIFYFGVIGLTTFIFYFVKVARTCAKCFPRYAAMFMLILLINMIVWVKVSTDIFLVFAIFLCISKEENDAYEREYEDSIPDSLDV